MDEQPTEPASPQRRGAKIATILVAFGVFALAIAVFAVPALRLSGDPTIAPRAVASTSYPAPPQTGMWILFPAEASPGKGSGMEVVALTNLPDGTLVRTSDSVYGPQAGEPDTQGYGCCSAVKGGVVVVGVGNQTCYGLVGDIGNSAGFAVTITVSPEPDMPHSVPMGGTYEPQTQPDAVLQLLGDHFQYLQGDQVRDLDGGSGKELVATSQNYTWTEPQCGSDFPLWGGDATCQPEKGQLQGDDLGQAMGEVMGALTQARMCEFWGLELTEEAAAAHPWPDFSAEWNAWYTDPPKDFSDANSDSTWGQPPVTWEVAGRDGAAYLVDVTDDGIPILRLRIEPLPDYCPDCSKNVVPFWGVTDWTFLG